MYVVRVLYVCPFWPAVPRDVSPPDVSPPSAAATKPYYEAAYYEAAYYDVVVYAAPPGGVMAAVAAAREGRAVALLEAGDYVSVVLSLQGR